MTDNYIFNYISSRFRVCHQVYNEGWLGHWFKWSLLLKSSFSHSCVLIMLQIFKVLLFISIAHPSAHHYWLFSLSLSHRFPESYYCISSTSIWFATRSHNKNVIIKTKLNKIYSIQFLEFQSLPQFCITTSLLIMYVPRSFMQILKLDINLQRSRPSITLPITRVRV